MKLDVRKLADGGVPLPLAGVLVAAVVGVISALGLVLDGVSTGLLTKGLVVVLVVFVVMCRFGGPLAAIASVWGMGKAWKVWAPVVLPLLFVAVVPRAWFVAGIVFAVAMVAGVAGGVGWTLRPRLEPVGGRVTPEPPVEAARVGAGLAGAGVQWWQDLRSRGRGSWKAREIRRGWEKACEEMGFDAGRKGGGDGPGPRRIPTLLKGDRGVRVTPESFEFGIIPRGDQDNPLAWAKMAARMEGHYGCHSSSYELFVPKRPNTRCLRVMLGRRPMRTLVDGVPVEPSNGRGWIIGERAGGGYLRLRLGNSAPVHALVVGGTGGGKTNTLRGLCMQAHADGWPVFVIDPKGDEVLNDFMDLRDNGVVERVIHDVEEAAGFILAMEENRNNLAAGVHADGAARILLVIDEVRDIVGDRGTRDPLRDVRRAAAAALTDLAVKGRSAGIHLVLAIQRADVAELGPSGGFLRAQLQATISTGDLDDDGYEMAFSGVTPNDRILMTGKPGRGMVQKVEDSAGGDVIPVQCVLWPASPIDEDTKRRMREMREKNPEATYADLMRAGKSKDATAHPVVRQRGPQEHRQAQPSRPAPEPVEVEPEVPAGEVVGVPVNSGAAGPSASSRYARTLEPPEVLAAAVRLYETTGAPITRSDLAVYLGRPANDGTVGRCVRALVRAGSLTEVAKVGRSTLLRPAEVVAPDPVSHGD